MIQPPTIEKKISVNANKSLTYTCIANKINQSLTISFQLKQNPIHSQENV